MRMPFRISVTVKEDGIFKEIEINPWDIDYVNPELGACTVHFVNKDSSIYIYQDEKELTRRIRDRN